MQVFEATGTEKSPVAEIPLTTSGEPPWFESVTVCGAEIFVTPVAANVIAVAGDKETPGGARPLPESATDWDRNWSETVSTPNVGPTVTGLDTTAIAQVECPLSAAPQSFIAEKFPPLTCTAISVNGLSPAFVRVTVCAADVVDTCCGEKPSIGGDRPSVAAEAPVPFKAAVCVPAESVSEKTPLRRPDAVGVNTIATVHPVDSASVVPQVLAEIAKSPDTTGVCSVAGTPPVLDTVTFSAGLLAEPSVTVPKFALLGLSTMAAGRLPVPLSAAVACKSRLLPGVLPATVKIPDRDPPAPGENVTCTAAGCGAGKYLSRASYLTRQNPQSPRRWSPSTARRRNLKSAPSGLGMSAQLRYS